ncbi:MAG: ABC transporter permease [Planctomycetes bacterium]|nr:ABC transporter permease [Planctomycetota bacterium]
MRAALWLRQVAALAIKEFLTILKDPKSRFVVIGPPLIQFFVFGYAATFDVTDVAYAVFDEDRSPESRDLLARFAGSQDFALVAELDDAGAIRDCIDSMQARLVLHVAPDFAASLHAGHPGRLQVILDGRNSNVSGIAGGYVQSIVAAWSRDHGQEGPVVDLVQRAWFNPTLDSRWFIVSGLPAQIALVVVMLLTSLSVAREREQGTFDQTLVAPLDSLQILVGKATPPFVLGLFDGLLLSAGAVLWFGVPMVGSIAALLAILAIYSLAVIGVGLLVSSLATTMQQGLLGAFMVMMPAVLLSGFTTPIENMPDWLQALTLANPARYAVAGCRAVFLEGAGLSDVAPYVLPLGAIAALTLGAAGWLFRHRTR